MVNLQNSTKVCSAIFGALLLTSPTQAQSNNPAWVEELEIDLNVDHQCEVAEYLSMHEGQLGGRNTFTARVKCKDGRLFDAHKIEPQEEFIIKKCEIVAC